MSMTGLLLPLLLAASLMGVASGMPHIIIILADDLGWYDVSFHGSARIQTPNIDALAYNGVILNSHYVQQLCTPTRGALLTGKYPHHLGMQHSLIASQPYGLPLKERLMSEHLKGAGYQTRAIGKWHLGCYKSEYTPLYRGFEHHFGFMNGFQDYFNQTHNEAPFGSNFSGYDMRRDFSVDWKAQGGYSTDMFTEEAVKIIHEYEIDQGPLFMYLAHSAPHAGNDYQPFQAPDDDMAKINNFKEKGKCTYAAMVSKLDESVGEVMAALSAKKMLRNSIVVFMSDNGAPTEGVYANPGSNFPLRGIKNTAMEGAMRGVAAVYSPLIKNRRRVSMQLMHVTDWLPTLFSAAGLDVNSLGDIDGKDVWDALVTNKESPRVDMVYNFDDTEFIALRRKEWKFINGSFQGGKYDGHPNMTLLNEVARTGATYDVKAVLNSEANIAIRKSEGAKKSLQADLVRSLRQNATVVCGALALGTENSTCNAHISPCLFNLAEDPCERNNLAAYYPRKIKSFKDQIAVDIKTTVPILSADSDAEADPKLWSNAWSAWQDDRANGTPSCPRLSLMQLALFTLSYIMLNKKH